MSTTRTSTVRITRGFGVLVALFGGLVVLANAHNRVFASHPTTRWVLFGSSTNFPGDFGRNLFAGSIALGVLVVAAAGALLVLGGRSSARLPGVTALVLGAFFLVTYRGGNNLLAASPAPAAVLMSAGLVLLTAPVDA
jgi:hypothetical protein